MEVLSNIPVIGLGAIILVVLAIIFLAKSYVKAPPDTAYIVSGCSKKGQRVVVGRATLVIPFFERVDKLLLRLMQIDIKTASAVPTAEYINIFVDGVANIKIKSDPESILKAAQSFLGKRQEEIAMIAQQVVEGNMREIVGQMELKELIQNRDKFAVKVQESVAEDMGRMGLEVVNLTIQNFTDETGTIENLGIDNIVKISQAAAIARADAEKNIKIAQAEAEKEASKAEAEAETQIALQQKEVAIKKAEFKKEQDAKQAEADSAYAIQQQEQRKTIETTTVLADIAKREKEVELQEKEIAIKEKMLEATIKKQAEAEKYAVQQKAEADKFKREQEAIAARIEREQEAEAEKKVAEAKRVAMEEEAKGIRAKGEAEASAIEAKAEALKKMNEVGKLEMILKVLPDVVSRASAPLAKTNSITMYGEGNSTKLVKDVMETTNQITKGLGVDLNDIMNMFSGNNKKGSTKE